MATAIFKRTQQREAIVNFLKTRKDHPTAEVIYQNVRKEHPNISLGTVYRNLSILSERGDILRLNYDGKQDHFDACTTPHCHFYCKNCHAITDLNLELPMAFLKKARTNFKGKMDDCFVFFNGICEECEEKNFL